MSGDHSFQAKGVFVFAALALILWVPVSVVLLVLGK